MAEFVDFTWLAPLALSVVAIGITCCLIFYPQRQTLSQSTSKGERPSSTDDASSESTGPPADEGTTTTPAPAPPPTTRAHSIPMHAPSPLHPVASEESSIEKRRFPMHVMRMKDFLALTELRSYNELVREGLVVSHEAFDDGEYVNFISHQWLGWDIADPQKVHLETMQWVFRSAYEDPRACFRDEDQWSSYMQGVSVSNMTANRLSIKRWRSMEGGEVEDKLSDEHKHIALIEHFRRTVAPETSWVWMDFLSIPQTVGCQSEAEVVETLANQAAAIKSIPAYVKAVTNFFICAPMNAEHTGLCQPCNLDTWFSRGWCRLEETMLMLARCGDGRPLFVTQPKGVNPMLFTNDSIDRLWDHTQRYSAVLTGNFSCCRMQHQVTTRDGREMRIPCDKNRLRAVLERTLDEQLERLKPLAQQYSGPFWKRLGSSFPHPGKPFFTFMTLRARREHILATQPKETEADLARFPSDAEGIAPVDCAESYFDDFGMTLQEIIDEGRGAAVFVAAAEGNLPLLRYFHEKLGEPLHLMTPFQLTPLLIASRVGNLAVVSYLVPRLTKEQLDQKSANLGLAALGDAAKCGWPDVIRVLIDGGADIEVQRANGRTPLHQACVNGHAECVRCLLASGADASAVDDEGSGIRELIEACPKGRDSCMAVLREFKIA